MAQDVPDTRRILDLAERAEKMGFDSVWVGDSVLARPRLDALTTLAAVAARTERVKLGTAVLLPALRHPVVLANEVANLDLLSQGRLILGLGIATKNPPVEREFTACGISFAKRIGIFEESITIIRRLWSESKVTFSGRHFQLHKVQAGLRPVQKPGVPLWLAGSVDNALRRVLCLGDGWMPIPPSPQLFVEDWGRLQILARELSKDDQRLHRCLYTTLNINEDAIKADGEMRKFIENYYGTPYEQIASHQGICVGTVERCASWLMEFVNAGAETIILRFGASDQVAQMERFAKDVLPIMRKA
jgi:probable F420-dependent oxidoreductase